MADSINNLGLCAGAGMLDLAVELAFGCRTVGYVEREAFAASVLLARMEDEALEPAPVWCGNLEQFDAAAWRGAVDSVTAGFPCQPWSAAGKRAGFDDERWIWPAIAKIIRESGAWLVCLENVPGLVSGRGLNRVLGDLAEMGFDAEWGCLTAAAVGASHQRARIFILAVNPRRGRGMLRESLRAWRDGFVEGRSDADLADASGGYLSQPQRRPDSGNGAGSTSALLADAGGAGREGHERCESHGSQLGQPALGSTAEFCRAPVEIFAPGPSDPRWAGIIADCPGIAPAVESGICIVADGLAVVVDQSRADQLRAIGNGVVPLQAAVAFRVLAERLLR